MGTSGSGKSTLMHLLGGVDNPAEGMAWIDGMDIYKLGDEKRSMKRSVGGSFLSYKTVR